MAIIVTYFPGQGISFGETFLKWGVQRHESRDLLHGKFETDDSEIHFNEDGNGITADSIKQRRDIYDSYLLQENLFFLGFDEDDKLIEVEVHHGLDIKIESIVLNFSLDIETASLLLEKISKNGIQVSEGEYFFKDLNVMIASAEVMGGESTQLDYFYCCLDGSHLIENES